MQKIINWRGDFNMKKRKYCLVIGIVVLFILSSCVQKLPSSAAVSETSSVVNSEETTFNLINQYDENELMETLSKYSKDGIFRIYAVFEYPSPDKTQKFIEVKASEGDPEHWTGEPNDIFLNNLDNFFYMYDDNYNETVGAVWIDNDTVAIAAEFIVNLKTGERKNMGLPVVETKYSGTKEMRMTSGLYIKELDSLIYIKDYDLTFFLLQYNLKNGTWTEMARRPFDTQHSMCEYLHFKRENENEVSFNTEKKQRLSFNFYTKEFREIPYVGDYYGE